MKTFGEKILNAIPTYFDQLIICSFIYLFILEISFLCRLLPSLGLRMYTRLNLNTQNP